MWAESSPTNHYRNVTTELSPRISKKTRESAGFPFDAVWGRDYTAPALQGLALVRSTVLLKKGNVVNKNDLIASVADSAEISKADATKAVDAVLSSIAKSLKKGDEVRLVGFGTFSVSKRAATEGRNPRTGEKIKIPASKQPKFKAGKALKDAVN